MVPWRVRFQPLRCADSGLRDQRRPEQTEIIRYTEIISITIGKLFYLLMIKDIARYYESPHSLEFI